MADKKISALTELTVPGIGDLLHVIDTSSTYQNKKMTVGNMFQNIPTFIAFEESPVATTGTGNTISVGTAIDHLDLSSGNVTATLPDGTNGQIKIITAINHSSTNTGIVTVTNFHNGSSLTFDAAYETVILLFTSAKWLVISNVGSVSIS